MSSRDIYNKATVYNPVGARTQAPQHNHTSSRPSSSQITAPSSSRPSSSAAPNPYSTLERDNRSSSRASSSRPSQQYTTLQRDGQASTSRDQTWAHHNHTLLNRDQQSSSSSRQPTIMRAAVTTAPPDAKSKFKTQHDVDMASKQVRYQQMNHDEKKKQDEWVSDFIQHAGPCVAGFSWERVRDGYVCNGGNHLCTDELLAEGKGGFYFGTLNMGWWGPVYESSAQIDYTITAVYEHARKHGLDPTVAPVIPDPDLPATREDHPGIAKAMAGLGPFPQACSNERVRQLFADVGARERNNGGMNSGCSHHMPGGSPQLSTLYGPGGRPNRLSISTSNGSLLSTLSQAGLLPHGYVPPSYGNCPHGRSGLSGNGPYGQGPHGYRRR
ncbi:hypothetical protein NHQ30_010020 [Ciborinia camelliae]|nr:hypothetical protein NHQ30_010020 [Ciborinia camelliae]